MHSVWWRTENIQIRGRKISGRDSCHCVPNMAVVQIEPHIYGHGPWSKTQASERLLWHLSISTLVYSNYCRNSYFMKHSYEKYVRRQRRFSWGNPTWCTSVPRLRWWETSTGERSCRRWANGKPSEHSFKPVLRPYRDISNRRVRSQHELPLLGYDLPYMWSKVWMFTGYRQVTTSTEGSSALRRYHYWRVWSFDIRIEYN